MKRFPSTRQVQARNCSRPTSRATARASKLISLSLLLCVKQALESGSFTCTLKELRELAVHYDCYDSANFSKTLKANKNYYNPREKGADLELSGPGRKKAGEIIKSIAAGESMDVAQALEDVLEELVSIQKDVNKLKTASVSGQALRKRVKDTHKNWLPVAGVLEAGNVVDTGQLLEVADAWTGVGCWPITPVQRSNTECC